MYAKKGETALAISTFKRYEKKFIITKKQCEEMLPVIEEHMTADKYCVDGKFYRICNLYFDTKDNDIIRHSVSKPYHKEKLRLRSYDRARPGDTLFLELKKKTGKIVTKRRVALTVSEANDYIYNGIRPKKGSYLQDQVLDEIDYFRKINDCHPAVFIAYDRRAYFEKNNKDVRLTFDFNIITRREDLDLTLPVVGEKLLPDDMMLMEVKIPGAFPLWLARMLSEKGIYMTSFSKYGQEYKKHTLREYLMMSESDAQ